jgi:hypothetical protein
MNDLQNRLKSAIEKYKNGTYSESDFHMTLSSIENTITEYDFFELKDFLIGIDASLEHINFMVDKVHWKEEYLKIISQIEEFVNKY